MAAARSAEQNDSEVIGALTIVALVTVACLVLLPATIVGFSAAEIMRRRRLRWTWTLVPLGACLIPLALFGAEAVAAVRTAVDHGLAGRFDAAEIARAGAPWWLAASCLVAAGWKLRCDRYDRYHGGERARELDRERGPVACLREALSRWRAPAAGAYVAGSGVRVGRDLDSGLPVKLDQARHRPIHGSERRAVAASTASAARSSSPG